MSKATKKTTKTTKAPKAAPKAAKKPLEAKGANVKAKTPTKRTDAPKGKEAAKEAKPAATPPAKVEERKAKMPNFTPIALPAIFKDKHGEPEITITTKRIIYHREFDDIVFGINNAQFVPQEIQPGNGNKLSQPIHAGSMTLCRGNVGIVLAPDIYGDVIAAILTAKAAAKTTRAKGGAK